MSLLFVLACQEPEHIDPRRQRTEEEDSPVESTPPVDSEPPGPGSWEDPIVDVGDMDVTNSGMELTDAVLAGDRLLLSGQHQQGQGGLWLVDVSEPEAPAQLTQGNVRTVQYVCFDGTDAWGVDRLSFLFHITFSDDQLSIPGRTTEVGGDIDCDADHVAWGAGLSGARLADNLGDGELGEELEIEGTWWGVRLVDESLYVAGVDEVARYDLDGERLAHAELPGWCRDMEVSGDTLAVACGAEGVHLLDAESLELKGTWKGHVSARTVAFAGQHLWLAAWTELLLLDVSDPTDPRFVGAERARSSVMGVVAADEELAWIADWRTPFTVRLREVASPELRLVPDNVLPGDRVAIVNDGPEPLWVEVDEGELSDPIVPAGDRVTLDVPEDFAGPSIEVRSDDPDEPTATIEVGSMNGLALGDPAPDWSEYDLDGNLWELQALRGEVVWLATFNDG